ncbi:MAG: hypothetical protein WCU80_00210 [Paludibacteraceae bacterium]
MGKRVGNIPCSEGWIQQENLGEKWRFFTKKNPGTDWISIKLAYDGELHKANYSLGWNTAEKRFSVCPDTRMLMARQIKLYKALWLFVKEEMYD